MFALKALRTNAGTATSSRKRFSFQTYEVFFNNVFFMAQAFSYGLSIRRAHLRAPTLAFSDSRRSLDRSSKDSESRETAWEQKEASTLFPDSSQTNARAKY